MASQAGRVDRIADAARSNKAQIYHYFGSKDSLFDAVFDAMCRETVDAVQYQVSRSSLFLADPRLCSVALMSDK
jgi:AcrR family transcriptional regulator